MRGIAASSSPRFMAMKMAAPIAAHGTVYVTGDTPRSVAVNQTIPIDDTTARLESRRGTGTRWPLVALRPFGVTLNFDARSGQKTASVAGRTAGIRMNSKRIDRIGGYWPRDRDRIAKDWIASVVRKTGTKTWPGASIGTAPVATTASGMRM